MILFDEVVEILDLPQLPVGRSLTKGYNRTISVGLWSRVKPKASEERLFPPLVPLLISAQSAKVFTPFRRRIMAQVSLVFYIEISKLLPERIQKGVVSFR
jgi:hypothetical protein